MKKLPTDDPLFGKGTVRADGRKLHKMYLFEVKKPDELKYPWDYYKVIQTIPPSEAWRPLEEGGCNLLSHDREVGELGRPVALVTGGGGDIGRAIALRLARNCRAVAIVDIEKARRRRPRIWWRRLAARRWRSGPMFPVRSRRRVSSMRSKPGSDRSAFSPTMPDRRRRRAVA